ncbi:MAG TPA: hypothetical protein VE422_09860 [Terriglobia bacterium]|nr:hypothetical protein [Terriglobia bacterium]
MTKSKGSIKAAFVVAFMVCLAEIPATAQTAAARPATINLPRTADGKPNFNGIWQVLNTAASDIQDHSGQLGMPPGQGVVEGGEIPYQPQALAKKRENLANRLTADPTEARCFLPGVPRATYMPYPFEIVQTPDSMAIRYEFAHALRMIPVNGSKHAEGIPPTWMGDSRGHWEGDTLVVDVANFNDQTWFDHAGNFHSDALHVVERYTMTNPDHVLYEATIEDPKVFTRTWKMSMPLYRRVDKNVKLLEYECVFYLQEERYKNAPFK